MNSAELKQRGEQVADHMAQRFSITATTQGAAFSVHFKAIAVLIAITIAYWGLQALTNLGWSTIGAPSQWMLGGAVGLVVYTLYHVLVSRTTVTPTHISQSFVFKRQVHLGEVSFAKFVYIPYLTWLIAPRLFVRTASNKFAAFYGSTHELHQVFGQIHRTVANG